MVSFNKLRDWTLCLSINDVITTEERDSILKRIDLLEDEVKE
jgi:hypothetical protein